MRSAYWAMGMRLSVFIFLYFLQFVPNFRKFFGSKIVGNYTSFIVFTQQIQNMSCHFNGYFANAFLIVFHCILDDAFYLVQAF